MSGGHINYLQGKEAQDIIGSTDLLEEIEYVSLYLGSFGDLAKPAIARNNELLAKMRRLRAEIETLDTELNAIRPIYRAVDYRGSNDIGEDDVKRILTQFNENNKE